MIEWGDILKIAVLAVIFLVTWGTAWDSYFAAKKKKIR